MLKINVNELKAALKKTKGFVKDSIVMEFSVCTTDTGKEQYLKVVASNGVAQATVAVSYVGDNEETVRYIVAPTFIDVVESISVFGDEVTIEALDNTLKLECGDAVVPVACMKDGTVLKMQSLKKVEKYQASLKAAEFADLVSHGGFAAGDATMPVPVFKETVVFTPCVDGEKLTLRALSCNGAFVASAEAEVETVDGASFNKFAGVVEGETQKSIAINYASLLALAKRIESEKVNLVFTAKQVVVSDGRDVYLFAVVEGAVPGSIVDLVVGEVKKCFEYTLDRDTLKKAITVVCLTGERLARLSFNGETLTIEDGKHTSRAAVPMTAVMDSKAEVLMDANFVKSIASTMPAELTVYSPEGGKGVYFEGTGSKAYLLPVKE